MKTDLLSRFEICRVNGDGWMARCPIHADHTASLSIVHRDARWLLHCHAGCPTPDILAAVGVKLADLFDDARSQGNFTPTFGSATVQPLKKMPPVTIIKPASTGLTLAEYGQAKGLPLDFLRGCGLSDTKWQGQAAVRIPYFVASGEERAIRYRIGLVGDRFRWKTGDRPGLYGLHKLDQARDAGHVTLVEGESDCHTLWYHGIPAVGIPGADTWREARDAGHLKGIPVIFVVVEPDKGGETVKKWLASSEIRDRVKFVSLPLKDPSSLFLDDPDDFRGRWAVACQEAVAWTTINDDGRAVVRSTAWSVCEALAGCESILEEFDRALSHVGVVGERPILKLLYLVVTSRLLDCPVSAVVKGPSSGGKSFVVESTLRFFPSSAYYALTAMSERALAYSTEPLKHRFLVIYEQAGMESDFSSYLLRSLLSEGRVRYETVEKTADGMVPRLIEREGPTGLLVTTTKISLHPENETRLLTLSVTDTPEQTKAVFASLARDAGFDGFDLTPWHALQEWLASGPSAVVIPYADRLADLVPATAVRLRRDFRALLMLIKTHALLHQATRLKDASGRIIATIADYAAVRGLVAPLIAEGVDATVKPVVRQVVEAIGRFLNDGRPEVAARLLVADLKLDKSVISRRVGQAISAGYVQNLEDRKGRPSRLILGDPLPDDVQILPTPEVLQGCVADGGDTGHPRADDEAGQERLRRGRGRMRL